jgi:hypothetical protein
MQDKSLIKILRFSFCLIAILITQNSIAQTLKTFSGSFDDGKATYTYYLDEYGNKVKHGNFTYSESITIERATASVKISGFFSDGKRNGKWTFETVGKGSYTKNVLGTYVKYNLNVSQNIRVNYKNGILNGEFYFRAIQNDYIPDLGQYGHVKADITSQFFFEDGAVKGKFTILDKDKDEPQNMSGTILNGYFDGLLSDNGRELVFTQGIMTKNQNWNKNEQDNLKENVQLFQPYLNSSTEEREINNFSLKEYCSNYPTSLLEKYIAKFYNSSDYLHDEIGGDDGYKSAGCYYLIENFNDKLDFTQTNLYKTLETAKKNVDVFEFISTYNNASSNFDKYKPSSLKQTNLNYLESLAQLDSILLLNASWLERQEKLKKNFDNYYKTTFAKEVIAKRTDVARGKAIFYVKTESGAKKIFCQENGRGFFTPAKCMHTDAVQNMLNKLNQLNPTWFRHPTNGNQYNILTAVQIKDLTNLESEFEHLEKDFKLLEETEDALIAKAVALDEASKKNTFEKSLADVLYTMIGTAMTTKHKAEDYLQELTQLTIFLQNSIELKSRIDGYSKNISQFEIEVGNSRNTLEKALSNFYQIDCKSKQDEFYVLLQNSINQGYLQLNKVFDALNQFEKNQTEAVDKIKSVIKTTDEFNTMNTTFGAVEFKDKTIAKYAKEIQTIKLESINGTYLANKNISASGSSILETTIQYGVEVNQYIELLNKLIALKNKELNKEQTKKLNSLKKNIDLLIEELSKM